jgi:glycerophosphoryl diester phosphodiesterase
VLAWRANRRNRIPLFIEIKHPTHFRALGLPPADLLMQTLTRYGLLDRESGVVLMSFETQVLRELRQAVSLPLVQLLDAPDARSFDWTDFGRVPTFADLITPAGLAGIAAYADGIGPSKRLIVPVSDCGGIERIEPPSSLIADAHTAGLFVCAWTFRDEPQYLSADYAGNAGREYAQFLQLGLDAFITDFPATAVATLARR